MALSLDFSRPIYKKRPVITQEDIDALRGEIAGLETAPPPVVEPDYGPPVPDDADLAYDIARHGGAISPDVLQEPDAFPNVSEADIRRRGGDIAPDLLQMEGFLPPPLAIPQLAPNPPFTVARGGSFSADIGRSGSPRRDLGEYLEKIGTSPSVARKYETTSVDFGNRDLSGHFYDPGANKITLSGLLQQPNVGATGGAAHEATHALDFTNKTSDSLKFRAAVWLSAKLHPEKSRYFIDSVPPDDPFYFAHVYTAAFDTKRSLGDLPPPLRGFYEGVLPSSPQQPSRLSAVPLNKRTPLGPLEPPPLTPDEEAGAQIDFEAQPPAGADLSERPYTAYRGEPIVGLPDIGGAVGGAARRVPSALREIIESLGRVTAPEGAPSPEGMGYTAYRGEPIVGLPDVGSLGPVTAPEGAPSPEGRGYTAYRGTPIVGLPDLALGGITAPEGAPSPEGRGYTAYRGEPIVGLPDIRGAIGGAGEAIGSFTRVTAPEGAPSPEGRGYTGFGANPLTVGEAAANLVLPPLQAIEQGVTDPLVGSLAAGADAFNPLNVPEYGKPLPGTVLKEIGKKAAGRNPETVAEWVAALHNAAADYERERPEAFPGEKFLTHAIFDILNLIGIGLEPKIAAAVSRAGKALVRTGKEAVEEAAPAVGAITRQAGDVLASERGSLGLGGRAAQERERFLATMREDLGRYGQALDPEQRSMVQRLLDEGRYPNTPEERGPVDRLAVAKAQARATPEELAEQQSAIEALGMEPPPAGAGKAANALPDAGVVASEARLPADVSTRMETSAPPPTTAQAATVPEMVPEAPAGAAKQPGALSREELIAALESKQFYGTVDRLQRGIIDETQAAGELAGTARPPAANFDALNPADVAAEMKGQGIGRHESWSRWVQRTALRPGMDAKDWYKIYDSVTARKPDLAGAAARGRPTIAERAEAELEKTRQQLAALESAAAREPTLYEVGDRVIVMGDEHIIKAVETEPSGERLYRVEGLNQRVNERQMQPVPEAPAGGTAAKQPWEMTQAEYLEQLGQRYPHKEVQSEYWMKKERARRVRIHKDWVSEAVEDGESVLPEVLADYPDLAQAAGAVEPPMPPVEPPRSPVPPEPGRAALNEANPERHAAWQMRNSQDMSPLLRQALTDEPETYVVFKDAARDAAADAMIAENPQGLVGRLLSAERWSDIEVVAAYKMVRNLYDSGLADQGEALARRLAQEGTPTGRQLRAFGFVHQLSPEAVVVQANRNYEKLLARKGGVKTQQRLEELTLEAETLRIRAETAERLAAVKDFRAHRVSREAALAEAIQTRKPLTVRAFKEGIEALLADETGAARLSRQNPVELPIEAMEPIYEEALRVKAMLPGPEKDAAKEAIRVRMRELEEAYSAGRQEMSAFAQMETVVDKWNARLDAQDAAKLAKAQKAAAEKTVREARQAALKATKDEAALARHELAVALKDLRAFAQQESKAQKAIEAADKQLSYITSQDARVLAKRIQTDEQQAINFLRRQVRTGDIALEETLARSFFDRAKALQSMPDPDRHWAAQQLMNDIAKIVPPTAWDTTLNVLGLARSLKASMDLSFPLRQGAFQWTRKEWRAMFGTQIKAFAHEDVARAAENRILFGQFGKVRAAAGLEFVDRAGPLYQMEEQFFSKWAQHVPLVKQSERAYITAGNVLRADVWDGIVRKWLPGDMQNRAFETLDELIEATGKSQKDFENLSKWLNVTTGRGDIPWLRTSLPVLNAIFFAPRFFVSRIQVPFYAAKIAVESPALRLEVARDMTGFVAGNMALLALLKASGVGDVELDPRSSDFGKGRVGPVRFDFWGGYQPIARYTAQFIMGQGKSTGTGRIYPKERIVGEGGRGTLFDFVRTKLSPTVGTGIDILVGQTLTGEPIRVPEIGVGKALAPFGVEAPNVEVPEAGQLPLGIARELAADFVPFLPGAIWESWQEAESVGAVVRGLPMVAAVGTAELFGGGTTAYHSVRDIQDRVVREGEYTDIYGAKATRYLDLSTTDRERVNEVDDVKAEFAKADLRESGRKPKYIEAMENWENQKADLESELRKHIEAGASGEALREAVQKMLNGRFERSKGVFTEDVRAEMERGLVKDTKDVLRDEYWSSQAPMNYKTNTPDFDARDRERAAVLDKADRYGVPRSYILDRGIRFKDSEVRKLVAEYEKDQETLRPYWDTGELLQSQNKAWAKAVAQRNALRPDSAEQKEFERTDYNWRKYQQELEAEHDRLKGVPAGKPTEIFKAGQRWGYRGFGELKKVGPQPPKPPVAPLPPRPPSPVPTATPRDSFRDKLRAAGVAP